MKEGWEYKKFEDALHKVKYTKKIQNADYLSDGVVPVISQEEAFISGYWDNRDDAFKVDSPVVIFGDHSRVVKYVDFDFVLGADGVKILKPIDGLNARFFYHFLKWYDVPSLGYSRHYKLLKEIDVPFPPLSEQQHIVEELDLLSSIIEKKKTQLKELDNLAQSLFYEMFGDPITNDKGWKKYKLEDVCDVRDGTHDSPKYVVESDYVLITSKNIQDGEISFENVNYITKEDYDKINMRSYVDDGDIIMAMIGTIGKPIIVKKGGRKFGIKNVALIKFNNSNCIINTYVKAMLDNPTYMDYIHSLNRGGTQKFVSLKTIRNLSVLLPPIDLQNQFASKIEAIEHQKELIKQSIKEVETLFNSRMDYYFN